MQINSSLFKIIHSVVLNDLCATFRRDNGANCCMCVTQRQGLLTLVQFSIIIRQEYNQQCPASSSHSSALSCVVIVCNIIDLFYLIHYSTVIKVSLLKSDQCDHMPVGDAVSREAFPEKE